MINTEAAVMLARLDVARSYIDNYGDGMTPAEVVELTTRFAITGTIACTECAGRGWNNVPMFGRTDCPACAASGRLALDAVGEPVWKS
jgi:hypothetical protein